MPPSSIPLTLRGVGVDVDVGVAVDVVIGVGLGVLETVGVAIGAATAAGIAAHAVATNIRKRKLIQHTVEDSTLDSPTETNPSTEKGAQ